MLDHGITCLLCSTSSPGITTSVGGWNMSFISFLCPSNQGFLLRMRLFPHHSWFCLTENEIYVGISHIQEQRNEIDCYQQTPKPQVQFGALLCKQDETFQNDPWNQKHPKDVTQAKNFGISEMLIEITHQWRHRHEHPKICLAFDGVLKDKTTNHVDA
jgi:hypothetical protein